MAEKTLLNNLENFCYGFMFLFCALDDAGMMLESKSLGHSDEMLVGLGLVPWEQPYVHSF